MIIQESSGSRAANSVGPLNQADAGAGPVVSDAEVFKGSRSLEAVCVEMVYGQAALVLVDQDERGTRDGRRIDVQGFRDRPSEPRLAGPQRTDQADDDPRSRRRRRGRALAWSSRARNRR